MSRQTNITEPVIAVAMEKITLLIGGAHQDDIHLADSRDMATVFEALDKLHRAGYELDPAEISAWAPANNWRPEAAAKLRDWAERTDAGRKPSRPKGIRGERLSSDVVEQWRQEALGRND